MTLIELLFFVLFAFVGGTVAVWAYHRQGWLGGIGGFVIGFFGTWAGLYVFGWILSFIFAVLYSGWPPRPACRTGKCHSRDYKLEILSRGQAGFRCQCGVLYRKSGRRFLEALPDGSFRPYMIWKTFRGWFPEQS
jgi:hypothetical protein